MELNIGDKIIYEDTNSYYFKGEIVDIWKNDNEEITAYFVRTDNGLHVHFQPSSLKWVRLDEPVPVP